MVLPHELAEYEKVSRIIIEQGQYDSDEFEVAIDSIRNILKEILLKDLSISLQKDHIDVILWRNIHLPIIDAYRNSLKKIDYDSFPSVYLIKYNNFIKFIRCSIKFYRNLIDTIAINNPFLELKPIIESLHINSNGVNFISKNDIVENSTNLSKYDDTLHICYYSLVALGDLSRYKEQMDKSTLDNSSNNVNKFKILHGKRKNWGPSLGYYSLARRLLPNVGNSYNQIAVISSLDWSPFSAIYYFSRAACAQQPFPTALSNFYHALEKFHNDSRSELKKPWFSYSTKVEELENKNLINLFLNILYDIHSITTCTNQPFKQITTSNHLKKFLNILKNLLKTAKVNSRLINKFLMIAFAFYSADTLSCLKLTLILKIIILIFNSIAAQLIKMSTSNHNNPASEDDQSLNIHNETKILSTCKSLSPEFLTFSQKIISSLRLSTKWIISNKDNILFNPSLLKKPLSDEFIVAVNQFWKSYARTITIIIETFSISHHTLSQPNSPLSNNSKSPLSNNSKSPLSNNSKSQTHYSSSSSPMDQNNKKSSISSPMNSLKNENSFSNSDNNDQCGGAYTEYDLYKTFGSLLKEKIYLPEDVDAFGFEPLSYGMIGHLTNEEALREQCLFQFKPILSNNDEILIRFIGVIKDFNYLLTFKHNPLQIVKSAKGTDWIEYHSEIFLNQIHSNILSPTSASLSPLSSRSFAESISSSSPSVDVFSTKVSKTAKGDNLIDNKDNNSFSILEDVEEATDDEYEEENDLSDDDDLSDEIVFRGKVVSRQKMLDERILDVIESCLSINTNDV